VLRGAQEGLGKVTRREAELQGPHRREAFRDADRIDPRTRRERIPLAIAPPASHPEPDGVVAGRAARIGPRVALFVADLAVVGACEILAVRIVHQTPAGSGSALIPDLILGGLLQLAAAVAFWANGLYARWPRQLMVNTFSELRDIIYALAFASCFVLGINHLFGGLEARSSVAPVTIVVALTIAALAVPMGRALARALMRAADVEHFRVLIVGSGMMAGHLLRYLSWDPRITVVGCVDDDPAPGTGVLGPIDDLPTICANHAVDQVIVSFSRTHPAEAIQRLQSLKPDIAISIVPRYFELLSWRSAVKEIAGLAIIDVAPGSLSRGARVAKRTFDLVLATLSVVILSPVFAAAAIAVKRSSPGPVFFRQQRVGQNGRTFTMLKLRTMVVDAEQHRGDSDLVKANEVDGPLFKMRGDPRVTRVGAFLRKSSLDELPQLLNVLRGDMSLVGPRPFIPAESSQIAGSAARRFDVRPGMTGLWQISGRSHLSYDELKRLDYLYVASWSLLWDLKILWHTPARVFRGHGAF
jgi:exopolysaccharide biosynthesis polyprenyl glycosylphosphotransferase